MLNQQSRMSTISPQNFSNLKTKNSSSTKLKVWKALQKVSIKFLGIASLVTVNLVTVNIYSQPVKANEIKVEDNIDAAENIVCLSTSGNGYNWAATLTWAAEIINDAIAQAEEDAKFNLACISGASSGSAFVATYGSLLQNKQLFPRADFSPQNLTKEEAKTLSNSLLYMALAADFRPAVVSFYTSLDGETEPNPPWWKSQFSLERVMLDFGTRVMLAQHISKSDVNQVEQLDQFVRYQTLDELKSAVKDKEIRDEYRQVTHKIWEQSQGILDRLYQDAKYPRSARKEDRDNFRDDLQHPVRQALAQKPADGILALNYAELAFTESTIEYIKMRSQAPSAETLVPFVFANKTTATQIIESPFYQQQVNNNDPYVGHYVICVVPDYYTMIRHGVKEPEMMPPGIYRLSPLLKGATTNLAAGVSHFYQPHAEKNWYSQPQFRLMPSTRTWHKDDKFLNARMGVAGGWIDSYVGGQATLYLGSAYAEDQSRSSLYYSTFSRRDGMTDFARKVVKKYFAPKNPKQAIKTIEKHRDHLPILMERYQQYYGNHEISWQQIFVDWSVRFFSENQDLFESIISAIDDVIKMGFNHSPVATTKESNYLLARTMNIVRQTLGTGKELGYIYDRSFKNEYYKQKDLSLN